MSEWSNQTLGRPESKAQVSCVDRLQIKVYTALYIGLKIFVFNFQGPGSQSVGCRTEGGGCQNMCRRSPACQEAGTQQDGRRLEVAGA